MTTTVAAIGLGLLGRIECRAYQSIDDVELVAGADVSPDARDAFEAEFDVPTYEGYETLLDEHAAEIDAVNVVTPHTLHYEHASACLERDLHVFLEKPLTTDLDDAVALVEESNRRDLVLQVGYQRHFDPVFREIKRVIDEGRLGDVHAATCYLGQEWITTHEDSWRTNPALSGGGQLYDSGGHLLDALLWTTGAVPASVAAQIEYEKPQIDVNSALSLQLDTDDSTIIGSVGVS
ncbi:MAG TPA: Gfo/Idh/MocA family oxidoreductase, partial [Natronoarchaeum rubrum]|nr:Gfo/Idh/MocA family oxidoreductase [Natronoarchaeum rubrum]